MDESQSVTREKPQMTEEQRKAHNERMKVYMRAYRAKKKLASGAVIALEASVNTPAANDEQSSPVATPDAA